MWIVPGFLCIGYPSRASFLTEPVVSKLLSESKYSKLSVKDGDVSVSCCWYAEENGAGGRISRQNFS